MVTETRPRRPIHDVFVELGQPGNEGKAFAITEAVLKSEFGDVAEILQRITDHNLGYTPAVWHDLITGNYLVERLGSGRQPFWKESATMQRVA